MFERKPLVAIVGPTGVGKSRLAIGLALRFKGEIVNGDSRQVYRGMDIGTGKPSKEEMAKVPHHLMDLAAPDQDFSLAVYQRLAYEAIEGVLERGRLPLLVGGSGLYMKAVVEGLQIPEVPPDEERRAALEEQARNGGPQQLHETLMAVDPVAAERIKPSNIRRTIRALEVYYTTGIRFSELGKKSDPGYQTLTIGLTCERKELYRRIDERVEEMMKAGFLEEVRRLVNAGYNSDLPSLSSVGYWQLARHLAAQISLNEAIKEIKFTTHRLARRQHAWFRPSDPKIRWIDVTWEEPLEKASVMVEGHLSQE